MLISSNFVFRKSNWKLIFTCNSVGKQEKSGISFPVHWPENNIVIAWEKWVNSRWSSQFYIESLNLSSSLNSHLDFSMRDTSYSRNHSCLSSGKKSGEKKFEMDYVILWKVFLIQLRFFLLNKIFFIFSNFHYRILYSNSY